MKDRYFEGISRKSIIVYGVYPPPFGGVSVHIQRVVDALSYAHNKVFFFNVERTSRRFFLLYYAQFFLFLIQKRPDQIHFHATYLKTMILDVLILFVCSYVLRYEIVIIDHDCRHLSLRSSVTRWLYSKIVQRIIKVVMIGDSVFKSYQENGLIPACYSIENAFLPPIEHTGPSITATYPSSLFVFLKERTPLILMNAAHIMIVNNADVYGLDLAVEMIAQLKQRYPDVGLIIALADINNVRYIQELYKKMQSLDCAEQIYILQNQKELWPLFQEIDLFIRPTLSDGSSISVQEALYFNVPVVASDAVVRPQSVHLYITEDVDNFAQTVEHVLQECVYGNQRKRNNLHEKSAYRCDEMS